MTTLTQHIMRCDNMGVPFIYEGLRYKFSRREAPAYRRIECGVVDPEAVPEVLHILPGTYFVGYMDGAGIRKVVIPATVWSITNSAFSSCTQLTDVQFEQGSRLESIMEWAFNNCPELEHINLIDTPHLKVIQDMAFYNCRKLREIYLPPSVGRVGDNAFSQCLNLRAINMSCNTSMPAYFSKGHSTVRTRKIYYDVQKER